MERFHKNRNAGLSPELLDKLCRRQIELSKEVVIRPPGNLQFFTGVDVHYRDHNAWPALVTMDPAGAVVDRRSAGPVPVSFPYIHGYFCFREGPIIEKLLQGRDLSGHCLMIDGHGLWHYRRCGLASYLGVMLDVPTIGCAKAPLTRDWTEPHKVKGDWTVVKMDGREVAASVRTRSNVKPVWVSPGHLCDLETAVSAVIRFSRFRIPDPLRFANHLARSAAQFQD